MVCTTPHRKSNGLVPDAPAHTVQPIFLHSADALDDYVHQLEKEVNKYLTKDINYGKAAKRMYNVFRLVGRYGEAAFIRELFDEPASSGPLTFAFLWEDPEAGLFVVYRVTQP